MNFLAGIPRLPRLSERLLLRSARPMLPRRPFVSGLALPYGSGVLRGLLDSGVEPRRGLNDPLSTLPRLELPLMLPLLSVGASMIS